MKTKKQKPIKVQRIICPKCGELQVKIYPWSSFVFQGVKVPVCKKCVNANLKIK